MREGGNKIFVIVERSFNENKHIHVSSQRGKIRQ
jgi:hypothetical protein